tara:strand:- start:3 stop:143 length:141 start_codon:yes stop_codon:yes gene_type:complete
MTNMKAYKTVSEMPIKSGNLIFFRIDSEYNVIKLTTAMFAIKEAFK